MAFTNAEKQKRHRERQKRKLAVANNTPAGLRELLQIEIERLNVKHSIDRDTGEVDPDYIPYTANDFARWNADDNSMPRQHDEISRELDEVVRNFFVHLLTPNDPWPDLDRATLNKLIGYVTTKEGKIPSRWMENSIVPRPDNAQSLWETGSLDTTKPISLHEKVLAFAQRADLEQWVVDEEAAQVIAHKKAESAAKRKAKREAAEALVRAERKALAARSEAERIALEAIAAAKQLEAEHIEAEHAAVREKARLEKLRAQKEESNEAYSKARNPNFGRF